MLGDFIGQLQARKERDLKDFDIDEAALDPAFLERSKAVLEKIETDRLEKLKVFLFRKKIAIPLACLVTPFLGFVDYWLLFLQRGSDDSAGGLSLVFLGLLYGWVTQPKRQYVKIYKEAIMPRIATLFGNFTYFLNGNIPAHILQTSKIAPRFDRYQGEDYFEGEYKGTGVSFSEIVLKRRHKDSKGRTRYRQVFKGLAILVSLKDKAFYGHTVVDKNTGRIGEFIKEKSASMQRADLVDPEFESVFDVYTTDQVEARYLLDPAMMERFKGLQTHYDGEEIKAAFFDRSLLVLIRSNYNYFEPEGVEVPATDLRSLIQMKREIEQVLSLVDRLRLYDPAKVHNAFKTGGSFPATGE